MNHSFLIISTHSFVQITIPSTVTIQSAVFSLNPDTEHQRPKGSRFIFCSFLCNWLFFKIWTSSYWERFGLHSSDFNKHGGQYTQETWYYIASFNYTLLPLNLIVFVNNWGFYLLSLKRCYSINVLKWSEVSSEVVFISPRSLLNKYCSSLFKYAHKTLGLGCWNAINIDRKEWAL